MAWCDFLLHGSGPSLVGARDVAAFVEHTAKPFGVYGITHGSFLSGDDAAIVCRFEEQTSKGFMWRDIGLDDWLLDFDQESDLKRLVPAVMTMLEDRRATGAKVTRAQQVIRARQEEIMAEVKRASGVGRGR